MLMGRFNRYKQFIHATPKCAGEPHQGIMPNHLSRGVDYTGYRHNPAASFVFDANAQGIRRIVNLFV
jgi:hypothetical protein